MIFITGGVRSGKSTFAEQMAPQRAKELGGRLHYLATGAPSDEEMSKRIMRHQQKRSESEFMWRTWEQPRHIERLASSFSKKDVVLLDCVTTLLNNELFFLNQEWEEEFLREVFERLLDGIGVLQANCAELVLVSNEVLNEPLGTNELVLKYSFMLGNLHQELVKRADRAYLVESGIPILVKGGRG